MKATLHVGFTTRGFFRIGTLYLLPALIITSGYANCTAISNNSISFGITIAWVCFYLELCLTK